MSEELDRIMRWAEQGIKAKNKGEGAVDAMIDCLYKDYYHVLADITTPEDEPTIDRVARHMRENTESLDEDSARVLYENRWELYETDDDPPQQAHGDALAALDYLSGVLNNPQITTLSQNGWVELRARLENIRRHLTASGMPEEELRKQNETLRRRIRGMGEYTKEIEEKVRQIPYEMRMNARQTEGGLVAQRLLELWADKLESALASAPGDGKED